MYNDAPLLPESGTATPSVGGPSAMAGIETSSAQLGGVPIAHKKYLAGSKALDALAKLITNCESMFHPSVSPEFHPKDRQRTSRRDCPSCQLADLISCFRLSEPWSIERHDRYLHLGSRRHVRQEVEVGGEDELQDASCSFPFLLSSSDSSPTDLSSVRTVSSAHEGDQEGVLSLSSNCSFALHVLEGERAVLLFQLSTRRRRS